MSYYRNTANGVRVPITAAQINFLAVLAGHSVRKPLVEGIYVAKGQEKVTARALIDRGLAERAKSENEYGTCVYGYKITASGLAILSEGR